MWREFWNLDGFSFGCCIDPKDLSLLPAQRGSEKSKKKESDRKIPAVTKHKLFAMKLK